MRREKGFTLLELLLVIFIIGILATAALTRFGPQVREGAYLSEARSNISVIRSACEAYYQQFGAYPSMTQITTNGGAGSTSVQFINNPDSSRWDYEINTSDASGYAVTAAPLHGDGGLPSSVTGIQVNAKGIESSYSGKSSSTSQ